MSHVNETQIAEAVAETLGMKAKEVDRVHDAIQDEITKQLALGNQVRCHRAWSLIPVKRKARAGRNPRTGEVIQIEAKNSVRINLYTKTKEALNAK